MQTLARISAAALLYVCAFVANAANPGTLLVLNKSDNTVSLLDLASKKSVATIPTGSSPHEVAVSPDGRTAVDLQQYRRPHGIAWLRGNEVAVTTEGSKTLLVVDVAARKVTTAIETDQNGSHMVALAPTHDRAFVANIGSGSVSVIDLKTKQRVANIPSGAGTEGIDVSPDHREVWATNRGGNTVSIIDVASSKIVATLDSKSFPIRAKFTDDGKHVLVSNAQSGDVAVFDAASRREVQRIKMQSATRR